MGIVDQALKPLPLLVQGVRAIGGTVHGYSGNVGQTLATLFISHSNPDLRHRRSGLNSQIWENTAVSFD